MKPRKKLKKGCEWCVTGINKLTKERDVLTVPLSFELAKTACDKLKNIRANKREYLYIKIDNIRNYPPIQ